MVKAATQVPVTTAIEGASTVRGPPVAVLSTTEDGEPSRVPVTLTSNAPRNSGCSFRTPHPEVPGKVGNGTLPTGDLADHPRQGMAPATERRRLVLEHRLKPGHCLGDRELPSVHGPGDPLGHSIGWLGMETTHHSDRPRLGITEGKGDHFGMRRLVEPIVPDVIPEWEHLAVPACLHGDVGAVPPTEALASHYVEEVLEDRGPERLCPFVSDQEGDIDGLDLIESGGGVDRHHIGETGRGAAADHHRDLGGARSLGEKESFLGALDVVVEVEIVDPYFDASPHHRWRGPHVWPGPQDHQRGSTYRSPEAVLVEQVHHPCLGPSSWKLLGQGGEPSLVEVVQLEPEVRAVLSQESDPGAGHLPGGSDYHNSLLAHTPSVWRSKMGPSRCRPVPYICTVDSYICQVVSVTWKPGPRDHQGAPPAAPYSSPRWR